MIISNDMNDNIWKHISLDYFGGFDLNRKQISRKLDDVKSNEIITIDSSIGILVRHEPIQTLYLVCSFLFFCCLLFFCFFFCFGLLRWLPLLV